MLQRRAIVRWTLALALVAPLPCTVACGGSKTDVKHAKVKAGDMPAGGEWTGVYYSPTFGYLHLVKEGGRASGKWRTAAGDKWGELAGEVNGDLLKYEWKEHTIGMIGPTATSTGKGYFKYVAPPGENVEHEIHGEWGLGASEAGSPWKAIKQRNQKPDPASVMPDETQRVETGAGWDQSKPKPESGGNDEGEDDGWD
jgi:hypothetical protein